MKRKIAFSLFLLLSCCSIFAQVKKHTPRLQYHSMNQVGVLAGATGQALQLQTVNGLEYKTWFLGAGLGIDNYYLRSIPIFLHANKRLTLKPHSLFVYADGGYNLPWTSKKDEEPLLAILVKTTGGAYYEAGGGYLIPLNKDLALALSAGYSYKRLSQQVNVQPWNSIEPTPKEAFEIYTHSLRRIAIKVGLAF